jgi:Gram-negative bacterial TonB protein C-terminal
VNGGKVYEQGSDEYFPLGLQVLATAMVDPKPILDALRPGDRVLTEANGASDESGRVCFSANSKICMRNRYGLSGSLGAPGRSVDFTDYKKFKGQRVARLLTYRIDPGDSLQARITALGEFDSRDEWVFSVSDPTPLEKQIRSMVVPEADLRSNALEPVEIIWPQVLEDNNTKGDTSYYVSLDRSGNVREMFPLSVAVERADDSARRQIMKWKFKPVLRDGVPVQAEGVLNLHFDTRAYGPPAPLTDAEVRKLASNVVDPEFPPGATRPRGLLVRWQLRSILKERLSSR